jgi:hypothetical protein
LGAQSFGSAYNDRVCVCMFIEVSACACCERLRCNSKKTVTLSFNCTSTANICYQLHGS